MNLVLDLSSLTITWPQRGVTFKHKSTYVTHFEFCGSLIVIMTPTMSILSSIVGNVPVLLMMLKESSIHCLNVLLKTRILICEALRVLTTPRSQLRHSVGFVLRLRKLPHQEIGWCQGKDLLPQFRVYLMGSCHGLIYTVNFLRFRITMETYL